MSIRLWLVGSWLVALLVAAPIVRAAAYVPPPIRGHVTDTAGKLSPGELQALNTKLSDYRKCSSNEIAVFVAASLGGNTIEDVSYGTFNTWRIGRGGQDNGVLLVLAPSERRTFIATGKGVGGSLTDLGAWEIVRDKLTPRLKEERFFEAIDDGTTAIGVALGGCAILPALLEGERARPVSPRPAPAPVFEAPRPLPVDAPTHLFAMASGMVLLVFVAMTGARAPLHLRVMVSGIAGAFFVLTSLFFAGESLNLGPVKEFFVVLCGTLVFVNAIVWIRRWRRSGPTDEYRAMEERYATSSRSSASSSPFSASSDSSAFGSSSGSTSASSASSSTDYSGGGGSTGGGGAGGTY